MSDPKLCLVCKNATACTSEDKKSKYVLVCGGYDQDKNKDFSDAIVQEGT